MNKIKAFFVCILFFAEILILLPEQTTGITAHATIYIDGNADFASKALAEGWLGDGTQTNPYIIEDYDISALTDDGIEIRNTDVYFIIRNCTTRDGRQNWNCGISLYNVTNCTIQNVSSFNNIYGIRIMNSLNINITSNKLYSNFWYGIELESSPNNNITANQIYNNSWDGISLMSSLNDITSNWIYSNSDDGIGLGGSSNNITSNRIYNNSGDGIFLWVSSNNTITSNQISNNTWYGIHLEDSSYNNITANYIYNNPRESGIYLDKSSNNNITLNNIYNNSDGISLTSSSNNNITSNHVYSNSFGIDLDSSSNNNITSNQVYNNPYSGIGIRYSSNNNVTSNQLYNTDGISLYQSSSNNITLNQICNNSEGILLGSSSNNSITSNQIYNNSKGIFLDSSSNNGITSNQIYNNSKGIFLDSSSNNILRNSTLENNTYNFGVFGWAIYYYYNDIDTSNKINGKPIYYIIGQNNLVFDESTEVGYLGLVSCSNVLVTKLTLTNNGQGLLLVNASYSTITSNYIYNNSDFGILLPYSSNNTITLNHIYNNSYSGIYLDYSSNNNIISSHIYNHTFGIVLSFSSNNTLISSNHVYNNLLAISIGYSSNNNIISNHIYNNTYAGIDLGGSSNNNITSNHIYNHSYYGIELRSSSNNNITSNQIYNNDWWGIGLVEQSLDNNITSNYIHNNSYGILCSSPNNNITSNNIYNNSRGIYVSSSSNNNINANRIYDNLDGIYIHTSPNNILRNNTLENNTYNFGVRSGEYLLMDYPVYWDISHFYQDIDTSNKINGKPIYYIANQSNIVFNESIEIGYLGLISCRNVLVKNLTLTNNIQGLLLANTSFSTVTSNQIYNNSISIFLSSSSNNNISTNKIYNSSYGIYLWDSSSNNFTSNYIYSNSDVGIYLMDSRNNNFSSNYIYDNSYGISFGSSRDNNIASNYIYGNSVVGIYFDSSSKNNIALNSIYNNCYGVYLSHSSNDNLISANNIYNNSKDGIHLFYYPNNNNIASNNIYNNSYGIHLNYSCDNKIHYNNIWNNTNYGIYNNNTESKYVANAIYNWWGSASGPGGKGPGKGDNITSNVLYNPWLIEPLDLTPPTIVQTSPYNSEIDVPVDTEIVITFSESMNILTIPGNIMIEPVIDIQNYLWSNNNTTLTLIPNSNLSSHMKYTITLNTNITDSTRAIDSYGNIHFIGNHLKEAYTFSFRTKDITPPIPNAGNDIVVDEDIEIELNASLSFDNVGIINYTWSFIENGIYVYLYGEIAKYTFTQPGYYIITLNVSDLAGNWALDFVNITVNDITMPVIIIISPSNNTAINQNITLIYTISDNMDSLENLTITGPANGTVYSNEGNYTITITAKDRANNTAEKTIFFTIDKTAPTINITGVVDGAYYNINVTPTIEITDINLNISSITLNNVSFTPGTAITEEGNYVLFVEAIDKAGNTAQKKISFTIDKTPPEPVTIKVAGRTTSSVTLSWSKNDDKNFNRYEIWIATKKDFSDASCIADITDRDTTTYTITGLLAGKRYCFKVKVIDSAGNEAFSEQVSITTLKKQKEGLPLIYAIIILAAVIAILGVILTIKIKKKSL